MANVLSTVAALLVLIIATAFAQYDTDCATGLHVIVARGSLEYGEGSLITVAGNITDLIPGSDSVTVNYPAALTPYRYSERDGVIALTDMLKEYVGQCPESKIAIIGYSQGAQVIGDTLCGTSERTFNVSKPLPEKYAHNIVAVVQMADPSFVAGLPYDAGTSKHSGKFVRTDTNACLPYKNILRSYCNANDLFCANGTSLAVHLNYIIPYGAQAASFVVERYNHPLRPNFKFKSGSGNTSPSNSSPGNSGSGSSGSRSSGSGSSGSGSSGSGSSGSRSSGSGSSSSRSPGSGSSSSRSPGSGNSGSAKSGSANSRSGHSRSGNSGSDSSGSNSSAPSGRRVSTVPCLLAMLAVLALV